jgi:hypothetical protein
VCRYLTQRNERTDFEPTVRISYSPQLIASAQRHQMLAFLYFLLQ